MELHHITIWPIHQIDKAKSHTALERLTTPSQYIACEALYVEESLDAINALDSTYIIQQRIQADNVLNIKTYPTLEDAIVLMDIYRAHIYAEVRSYQPG